MQVTTNNHQQGLIVTIYFWGVARLLGIGRVGRVVGRVVETVEFQRPSVDGNSGGACQTCNLS